MWIAVFNELQWNVLATQGWSLFDQRQVQIWLFDWLDSVFYAVSAIFQPCNGGVEFEFENTSLCLIWGGLIIEYLYFYRCVFVFNFKFSVSWASFPKDSLILVICCLEQRAFKILIFIPLMKQTINHMSCSHLSIRKKCRMELTPIRTNIA